MRSHPVLPARRKIQPFAILARRLRAAQARGQRVVFTNGCFDILHAGHVRLLEWAKRQGDILVVGLNSDRSVRGLKGPRRPIVPQQDRALLLAAFACVDSVIIFDRPTPQRLIEQLRPDVLVKGSDWRAGSIVGREVVERQGGRVVRVPLLKGYSTSSLIQRIGRLSCASSPTR